VVGSAQLWNITGKKNNVALRPRRSLASPESAEEKSMEVVVAGSNNAFSFAVVDLTNPNSQGSRKTL
jgi:hypothetical protein